MCTKKRHAYEFQALEHLYRLWRTGRGKLPCRAYLCPTCGAYHLTSQPLKERVGR